jgi:flagellum-specific ATP synthase
MSYFATQISTVETAMPYRTVGTVESITGLTIEAIDLALPVGSLCELHGVAGQVAQAEVIGFQAERTLLMPLASVAGVSRGSRVENIQASGRIWCSQQLLGRVINGLGKPIDGKGPILASESRRIDGRGALPMERENIRKPISTGIKAIDGLHTCGLGQRLGIFSGPGVGKSTLMSSIARHTSADVSVIALIGERAREVLEFVQESLGDDGLKRCVIVVSTSDDAPLLRVRATRVACTVAEYFRDQGKDVLLMMDSLTRMAQAQRQIGLAAREPPATKGFPPSVFALIPEILERAGKTPVGSITGFYTVLVEGDDFNEPIPDAVKGITDGHFWLNRSLANRGHFPAIDVIQSISRVRSDVAYKEHVREARKVISLLAAYQDIEDLVNIGAYVAGQNLDLDLAVQTRAKILGFLQQEAHAPVTLEQSRALLAELSKFIELKEAQLRAPAAKPPLQPR